MEQTSIYRKRNVFEKYSEYTLEFVKIKLKEFTEYKVSFYMALLNNFAAVLTSGLLFSMLFLHFNEAINWSWEMYLFFLIITNLVFRFSGIFIFGIQLSKDLLSGTLNSFIFKPINIFFQYFMNSLFIVPFFISSLYFLSLLVFIFVFNELILFSKLVILIPFLFLSLGLSITLLRFVDSLAFFMKNNRFLLIFCYEMLSTFNNMPITLFKENIRKFFYLISSIFYGSYSTMFLFGKITLQKLTSLSLILIILISLLSLGIYLSWHFGLKRYEAFG